MLIRDAAMRVGKGDQSAWIVKVAIPLSINHFKKLNLLLIQESLISKYGLQSKLIDAPNHVTLDVTSIALSCNCLFV
jgi:hypothetical protein